MRAPLGWLLVILVTAPAAQEAQRPAPISPAGLTTRLARSLDSLATLDQFSGVVVLALAIDGRPVFEHCLRHVGSSGGAPQRRRNRLQPRLDQQGLHDDRDSPAPAAGKLDLDSTLARAWPDYPNREVARRVTIRQLLEHRSGIGGNIFGAPVGGNRSDVRRLRDYLPLFVSEPLQFDPGTRLQYSNAGYVVLGLLIERLSGEDYYDYVHRHIYQPAEMTRTAHWSVDSLPPNTALGYTRQGEGTEPSALHRNTDLLPGRGSSAGGEYSTAHDLLRFLAALRDGRIASGVPAGLGIAGGAPGLNAVVDGNLPGGYDLVVLANLDPPAAERIAQLVRGWLAVRD